MTESRILPKMVGVWRMLEAVVVHRMPLSLRRMTVRTAELGKLSHQWFTSLLARSASTARLAKIAAYTGVRAS